MINSILAYTNKYYPCSLESQTFKIVSDGIEGTFTDTYLVGQYVNIMDSVLNDGTYKITGVTGSKLTLDATLLEEESYIYLWGLQLPRGYITLIDDITTYNNSVTNKAELTSETQGNRSVTYKNGSSWQNAFMSQLANYRSMFDDRITYCRQYNINTKGW